MIQVENISMRFRMANDRIVSLKEYVIARLKGQLKYRDFWVFQDISFEVGKGEVVGIIGKNGAGKSTLLKIIAGVLTPTKGSVSVQGKVVPMLELGSGFDMELSGRENIFLNGSILGYGREFLEEHYGEILAFSELQEFIDMPIRNYSSGMLMRLAFSIATIVKPEVLIVDEILAVGDEAFQKKSKRKMLELMSGGTTVLFVSHSIEQIREMCNRVVWLENGKINLIGEAKKVCDAYQEFMNPTVDLKESIQERTRKTDAEKYYMDVLLIYGVLGEEYEWRVHNQKEQLLAGNMAAAESYYQEITEKMIARYRVFIFIGCPGTEEVISYIKKLKAYHKTVLIDCSGILEWKNNRIYRNCKAEIHGIVAATGLVEEAAKKEGFLVYRNLDVCSDRMEQLSEWAVYDREILPDLDVNQMSGDMEVVNYYRAVKKKEERKNRNLRIGCFCLEKEMVERLAEAVFTVDPQAELYLHPNLQLSSLMERYRGRIFYFESMEREKLPGIYADLDLVLGIERECAEEDSEKRQLYQQWIYAGLVKIPFFIWVLKKEEELIDMIQNNRITAADEISFYQTVKKWYQKEKWRKEWIEQIFSQVKKEATAINTGGRFTRWIQKQETAQVVFLLKKETEKEKQKRIFTCAKNCWKKGRDVLLLWDDAVGDLAKGTTISELARSEVYLYGSFDRVVAAEWEDCDFLRSYSQIRIRIFLQQEKQWQLYASGDYRRFQRRQLYFSCTEILFLVREEFFTAHSELFIGEYAKVKVLPDKEEEWDRVILEEENLEDKREERIIRKQ